MNSKTFSLVLIFFSVTLAKKYFAGLIEGDIAFRENDKSSGGDTLSAFLTHETMKWPYGKVPYYIDENSIASQKDQDLIREVIVGIETAAKCIAFQDISKGKKSGDHIRISAHGDSNHTGKGCWSYPGHQGGEQVVNLAEDCMEWGLIQHELLHALGQVHEHTRPDRDEHVQIIHENIEDGKSHNFKKREMGDGKNQVAYQDISYDMYSLLHYPADAWSKDGKSETIRPLNSLYKSIGGSGAMTATDKIELNLHYECSDISSSILVEYILEVEYRANMKIRKLEEDMRDIKAATLVHANRYAVTENLNCYTGSNGEYFGANDIEPDPWKTNTDVETCMYECVQVIECTGFIWGKNTHNCHLKKNINPRQCYYVTDGALYQLES